MQLEEKSKMSKAIVLTSGGIDSAVCLGYAQAHHQEVVGVFMDYGQRNISFTRALAANQLDYYGFDATSDLIEMNYRGSLDVFGEGIAGDTDLENEDGSVTQDDGRGLQYVPMRNLHFLAGAGAVADSLDGDFIYFGAQAWNEDVAPDARPKFVSAAQMAVNRSLADNDSITIETPIIDKSKSEAVEMGEEHDVPWYSTWSCYEPPGNPSDPEPCGECHSCKERAAAFAEVGIEAPFGTIDKVPKEKRGVQS